MALNTVTISGRLGNNAEHRTTTTGMAIVRFNVCVNSRKKENGEWTEKPNWVPCVMFGNYAEKLAPSLTKGRMVAVQGRLNESAWDKDGQHHSRLEVAVDQIQVMEQVTTQPAPAPVQPALYDTDVPF